MSKFLSLGKQINEAVKRCGFDDEVTLSISNRPDLGEFQINDAMRFAKIYHKNPVEIANTIKEELDKTGLFKEVSIAGAGFINLTLSDNVLVDFVNEIKDDVNSNIDKMEAKTIFLDYGGANVAKALHVGHLRPANIGEGLKRLAKTLGHKTISDVHLGDSGLQAGIVMLEMKSRFPDLPCFKEGYNGEDFELPIVKEDLKEIYPTGSQKAHEDEALMEEARKITFELQRDNKCYNTLWNKITALSVADIKETYDLLNCDFDLYEGERDSFKYIPDMLKDLENKNLLTKSEGATVIDIKQDTDTKEMPPVILVKSDGAYLYATTDLATIKERMERFNPDEIWYVTDLRQSLHFEQVFRAAKMAGYVPNTELRHLGNGTLNGPDGKPFKTRAGGVMSLEELIKMIYDACYSRINDDIVEASKKEDTAMKIALAALKYADYLPYRETDYIFDINKFTDLDGKTGPYLLYSTIRIKSLLNKASEENFEFNNYSILTNKTDREVLLTLLQLPIILNRAYESKSINEVAEYIYKLTSIYNKFYSENRILTEENAELKASWLVLSKLVYNTNMMLLNIMGINCPEKM
ncbi:MAG: arginine--tRNA ligase [Bacilli bacterium]|nr:arginine--tRNA ligase [Bacilli bacterium]